ncbi:hypothetical protein CRG98_023845 [Punica granatum]|uniref:Uncharacterized protein n=1 Tax=Punica granatum TaxID=22663 RepID=A0A2I0JHM9_PUNGR|nr:hypothetical protein CRG98_023845 [Punica granatum]
MPIRRSLLRKLDVGCLPYTVLAFPRLNVCTDPNVDSRRGLHCALLDRAAWATKHSVTASLAPSTSTMLKLNHNDSFYTSSHSQAFALTLGFALKFRVYFSVSQVRRACWLVPLVTLPGLLTQCEFTVLLRKFAEPAHSCLLQPCRVCSPVRVYFSA